MHESFGTLPSGEEATLYTISLGNISASITDYGATLVRLLVPDPQGNLADVTLGYDDVNGYARGTCFLGAVVGRSANRIADSEFDLDGKTVKLVPNEGPNNLHSGPNFWSKRFWTLISHTKDTIIFALSSPAMDQGYPGNLNVAVTYHLEAPGALRISYDAYCDQDTVFNPTQHAYFNLAGHNCPEKAMNQVLILPARSFTPDRADSIPTGELRSVEGTPMDFRVPKAIGRDIDQDYDALNLQGGYDHNYEVFTAPCAILKDPESGRTMSVTTDRPGIQFYAGNFLHDQGKGNVYYGKRSGIALETQCYPDAVHNPGWAQPVLRAGQRFHSETCYRFL